MKILFIVPYPIGEAASQRFRFEQYFEALRKNRIAFDVAPFWENNVWKQLYKEGNFFLKFRGVVVGFLKRFWLVFFKVPWYDFIFIHREAAPVGPPVIEWLIAKIYRKRIIYDFDDAIWIENASETNRVFSFLKFYSNTKKICRMAYRVSCGNHYLCNFARNYNSNVVFNPTTIDTENYHNGKTKNENHKFTIGWTGSHSTIKYLDEVQGVLSELERECDFEFRVIADQPPSFNLKSIVFVPWKKETEISDLEKFDIGLMPLRNDQWANGKCGFKALQYMSLGIPALVSPVGVNNKIVDNGINGYICVTFDDWKNSILKLMKDKELLKKMSAATRDKIEKYYSLKSNTENFLLLFKKHGRNDYT